MTGPTLY